MSAPIFNDNSFGLFISHRDSKKVLANKLKEALQVYGITCFVAHEDVEPSTVWQIEIEKALFSMDALLAILSEDFFASVWTNQEVGFAMGREKYILLVKLGTDPAGFVGKFQALKKFSKDEDERALHIAELFLKHNSTKDKMERSYFHALLRTASFDETNKWKKLLDRIESPKISSIDILINSYNNNNQAFNCYKLNGEGRSKSIADYINDWSPETNYILNNNKLVQKND